LPRASFDSRSHDPLLALRLRLPPPVPMISFHIISSDPCRAHWGKRPAFADHVEKIVSRHCAVEIGDQNAHRINLYEAPNLVRFSQSLKPRWLSGRCQNGGPPDAVGVDVFLFTDQHLDRDMDK